jgi:hypothetical protein
MTCASPLATRPDRRTQRADPLTRPAFGHPTAWTTELCGLALSCTASPSPPLPTSPPMRRAAGHVLHCHLGQDHVEQIQEARQVLGDGQVHPLHTGWGGQAGVDDEELVGVADLGDDPGELPVERFVVAPYEAAPSRSVAKSAVTSKARTAVRSGSEGLAPGRVVARAPAAMPRRTAASVSRPAARAAPSAPVKASPTAVVSTGATGKAESPASARPSHPALEDRPRREGVRAAAQHGRIRGRRPRPDREGHRRAALTLGMTVRPHSPLAVGFSGLDAPGNSRDHLGRHADCPGAGHSAQPLSAVRRVDLGGSVPDQPATVLLTAPSNAWADIGSRPTVAVWAGTVVPG